MYCTQRVCRDFLRTCWHGTVSSRAPLQCCQAQPVGTLGLTFTPKRSIQTCYRSGCGSGRIRGEISLLENVFEILSRTRAYDLYPTHPSGFSSHLVGTEQFLAEHGGRVARPNRSESWVLPLRQSVASRHVIAADAVLEEFEEKALYSKKY